MTAAVSCARFRDKKVLVVESEFLLPIGVYRSMEALCAEIIGPVAFPEDVLMLLKGNRPDVAIVDTALNGYHRAAVLGLLRRMHVPFVQACRDATCTADDGCFPLSDTQSDLTMLGEAMFA
jgi:DNA-binding NarL/FixJ family response regulator